MIRGHGQVSFLISTLDKVVQADGQAQVVEAVSMKSLFLHYFQWNRDL
jgi:uncharacterized tellurite resistance protein B-like protein